MFEYLKWLKDFFNFIIVLKADFTKKLAVGVQLSTLFINL